MEGHCWLISGHMSAGKCSVNTSSLPAAATGSFIRPVLMKAIELIGGWQGRGPQELINASLFGGDGEGLG